MTGSVRRSDILSLVCTDVNPIELLPEPVCCVIKLSRCASCVHLSRVKERLDSISTICMEVMTHLIWIPASRLNRSKTDPGSHNEFRSFVSWLGTSAFYDHLDQSILVFQKREEISFGWVCARLKEQLMLSVNSCPP